MMRQYAGAGGSVECSTSTTAKRHDVIARVFGHNGRRFIEWRSIAGVPAAA
jgi:hypothetical protein